MMVVDPLSGKKSSFASKKTIIEAFKNNQSKLKTKILILIIDLKTIIY